MSSLNLSGITVSPALEQLTLSANQTTYSFTAFAANHTNQPIILTLSSVDFTSANETGGIAFAGKSSGNLNNQHGLASWISLSPTRLNLAPGASQAFIVKLSNTDTLSPGGHYAAILLHLENGGINQALTNRIQINQDVSMLLFTATNGSGTRQLSLLPPGVGVVWFHMPQNLKLYMTDNGNTQVTPRGFVTIFSAAQKPLSRSLVNSGSALVLPDSTRLLETPTNAHFKPFWPGVYHLQIGYNYDGANQLSYYNTSFVYVGAPFVVIFVVCLVAFLATQFWRRLHQKYQTRR